MAFITQFYMVLNPFQPNVALYIETNNFHCKSNDWLVYEIQHWAEMGTENTKN